MIQLNEYGSAILLADMDFNEPRPIEVKTTFKEEKRSDNKSVTLHVEDKRLMTREEYRIARYEWENKRIIFVYDRLKEKYPDKDYADKFLNSNQVKQWLKPLRQHTEKTLKCSSLKEDKTHCSKERKNTSCYTCCFACTINEVCKDSCVYDLG